MPTIRIHSRQEDGEVVTYTPTGEGDFRDPTDFVAYLMAQEQGETVTLGCVIAEYVREEESSSPCQETPSALRSIMLLSRALGRFYLTPNIKIDSAQLELMPLDALKADTPDNDLIDRGFMYARFMHTGARVIVRPRYNRRWLEAWGCCVTDFEVYEVDTVVNADGTGIVSALGKKHPRIRRLFANADILPGVTS